MLNMVRTNSKHDQLLVTLELILMVLIAQCSTDERANYRFTSCGSRDVKGPTYMECIEHYCNSGSIVCGRLLNEGTRGSQIFVVPRSGNYSVTIAGASGGHGVCSNYSGLGVIAKDTVHFRRGEKLRVLVGQQGKSPCEDQDIDICQISNDTEACENLWISTYQGMEPALIYTLDGGGGGGGASLLKIAEVNDSKSLFAIAAGGGGAGALYNMSLFSSINISDDTGMLYRSHINGHLFSSKETKPHSHEFDGSAQQGAGYFGEDLLHVGEPRPLVLEGFGGDDCANTFGRGLLFPNTHGGFGGGGGGCDGGGGGGGYTGGSIIADGATIPGEGGYSWPDPPWPLMGYNDDDGYVELFLESCGCTYNCIIDDQSSFECSCPSDTTLALNGFDCYSEEIQYLEVDENLVFSYASYEMINANIAYLDSTIFAYSIAAAFDNQTSSNFCAVVLIDNERNLIATTKFINSSLYNDGFQPLELFTVESGSSNSSNMSFNLSVNSTLLLEEPLFIASVITFGIDGDCILEELMMNASIDDIYVSEPSEMLNLTSLEILKKEYLDFIISPINSTATDNTTTTNTTDERKRMTSSDELSAGAIAGIVVSVVVIILVIAIMLAVSIYFFRHPKHKSNSLIKHKKNIEKQEGGQITTINAINPSQVEPAHEYEVLRHGYENMSSSVEVKTLQRNDGTLRYGFKAPILDYHAFNCSRQRDDWGYDRAQLIYMREIGEGQFGKVLLMKAKDICNVQGSVLVAVKTLTSRNPKDIQRFSEEMDLMKKFIHPNIVSLLGHCEATSDSAPMMILELMQYGDLKWFLKSNRPNEEEYSVITESVAIEIVTDVATALNYLAANKFVHRDVAARNCLIGEGFKAKLSDFGLARGVHEKDYYKITGQTTLPVRWMAPESLLYGKFTSASDVWSYGVLVWEVATFGKSPHKGVEVGEIIELANNGSLKLNRPEGCPEALADIISQCTSAQSEDRLTFTEILEYFKKKQDTATFRS